eukprot:RCo051565
MAAFLGVDSPSLSSAPSITIGATAALRGTLRSLRAEGNPSLPSGRPTMIRQSLEPSECERGLVHRLRMGAGLPERLNLGEVREIVGEILPSRTRSSSSLGSGTGGSRLSLNPLQWRSRGSFPRRWRPNSALSELYSLKVKPTTRLICAVLVLSFVMVLVVAAMAVGLGWVSTQSTIQASLTRELQLVAKAVGSFNGKKRALDTQLSTARIVSSVIHEVGYNANLQTMILTMMKSVNVMGMMMDNLFEYNNIDKVALVAQVLGAVTQQLYSQGLGDAVPGVFTAVNSAGALPEGHEVILGQAVDGTVSLLSGCQSASCGSSVTVQAALQASARDRGSGGLFGSSVFAGYSAVTLSRGGVAGLGLVYTVPLEYSQNQFEQQNIESIDKVNADPRSGTIEMMLQTKQKPGYPLTKLKFYDKCPHGCSFDHAGATVISGNATWAIGLDYRETVPIISTATPLTFLGARNISLLYEIDVSEMVTGIMASLSAAVDAINLGLNSSQTLLLGVKTAS